jgi:hypothetical protein
MEKCAQKGFDRADIVEISDFAALPGPALSDVQLRRQIAAIYPHRPVLAK